MAARTQDQIYQKLKKWLPAWFFEDTNLQSAAAEAVAKMWAQLESQGWQLTDSSFLLRAHDTDLDRLGAERSLPRRAGETDAAYAIRIQQCGGVSDMVRIKGLVDGLLVNGTCLVQDHAAKPPCADRGTFASRGVVCADDVFNQFTIVVPLQGVPISQVLQQIQQAVDAAKASGVSYRIIELNDPSLPPL